MITYEILYPDNIKDYEILSFMKGFEIFDLYLMLKNDLINCV